MENRTYNGFHLPPPPRNDPPAFMTVNRDQSSRIWPAGVPHTESYQYNPNYNAGFADSTYHHAQIEHVARMNSAKPKRTFAGLFKKLWPRNIYSRITLLLAILQFVLILAFEIVILTLHTSQTRLLHHTFTEEGYKLSNATIVYHGIFIFALVFSLVIAFDMVLHKNSIEMIGFVLFQYLGLAYTIIQYFQHDQLSESSKEHLEHHGFHHNSKGYEITVIVLQGIFSLIYTFLTFKLLKVFGWQIYRKIGADAKIRDMYKWYQIMLTFIKFDFFFATAYSICLIALVVVGYGIYWVNIGIGLAGTAIATALGLVGLRRESKPLMYIYLVLLTAALVYLCIFLADMYPDHDKTYSGNRRFLTFFVVINMVLILGSIITAIFCIRNFGKGLKEQIDDYYRRQRTAAPLEIDKEAADFQGAR
ncbi:hypothetical protein BKA69DRAFT_1170778 [Paraphysoderma sedebokerense]|nr:hypothetical protein BKA69DRAFT_1170778 [Paraphysoderma sedebokerense]